MKSPFFHFSYNILPSEVKETINCNASIFYKSDLKISIKHSGSQIPILFHRVFCEYCETNTLPKLLNKYKEDLPEPAIMVNLIANWDVLKIQNQFCDVAGCLLPFNEDVIAGSNSRPFIKRPTDHVHTTHPFTAESERSKALKKKEKALSKSISSCKTIAVDTSKQASSNQATMTGKYAKKLNFRPIVCFVNSKFKLSEPFKDDMDRFGKGFCISIVHSGVNSCLSNNVILENYQITLKGLLTFWVSTFPFFDSNLLRKKL